MALSLVFLGTRFPLISLMYFSGKPFSFVSSILSLPSLPSLFGKLYIREATVEIRD